MAKGVSKHRDTTHKKDFEAKSESGTEPCAAFEVEMFPSHVDSVSHPYADQFKEMLEEVAGAYDCQLLSFDIHKGTVTFSFDSNKLNADILRIIQGESTR